jgi:hypothetical protein
MDFFSTTINSYARHLDQSSSATPFNAIAIERLFWFADTATLATFEKFLPGVLNINE